MIDSQVDGDGIVARLPGGEGKDAARYSGDGQENHRKERELEEAKTRQLISIVFITCRVRKRTAEPCI
jgi:hypothetical protein